MTKTLKKMLNYFTFKPPSFEQPEFSLSSFSPYGNSISFWQTTTSSIFEWPQFVIRAEVRNCYLIWTTMWLGQGNKVGTYIVAPIWYYQSSGILELLEIHLFTLMLATTLVTVLSSISDNCHQSEVRYYTCTVDVATYSRAENRWNCQFLKVWHSTPRGIVSI